MALSPQAVPELITGGLHQDERGRVSFVNDWPMIGVKRFYQVTNPSTATVRAWHGHLKEAKYVYVPTGRALVGAVPLDSPTQPNRQLSPYRYILAADQPQILAIPAGYANGWRGLAANTSVIFFSTASLEESRADDYRWPADYWGAEFWQER